MSAVAFAHRGSLPARYETGYMADLEPVFSKLAAEGVEPIRSADAEAAFLPEGLQAVRVNGQAFGTSPSEIFPLTRVGVIVSMVGRLLKKELLPQPEALPPIINENAVRSLGFNKARSYEEILEPLGLGIPTALIEKLADVDDFLAVQKAERIVVKPNSGAGGKGIRRWHRNEVLGNFGTEEWGDKPQVLQPALDFTAPMPNYLRAYDAPSAEAFNCLSGSNASKELRVFVFRSPVESTVFPVGRVLNDGDKWFFVDPDSIPEKLSDDSIKVIERAANVCGALALYGAVDFGYGTAGPEDPDWHIIEANMRSPHLITYREHSGVAEVLRNLFVQQLLAVVRTTEAGTR